MASLERPGVLLPNPFLILGRELIFNVEDLTDLLWLLPLDIVGNSLGS